MKDILLLALSNSKTCSIWKQKFEEYRSWDEIIVESDGRKVCERIQKDKPALVILDFHLSGLDGLGVLEWIQKYVNPNRPSVYMLFYAGQEIWIQKAYMLGAAYCAIQPCDAEVLFQRIKQSHGTGRNAYLRMELADALVQMGISPDMKGFGYILEGVLLAIADSTLLHQVTGGLYPAIAEAFQTKSVNVERAIRHAISSAWREAEHTAFASIFEVNSNCCQKPTNSEFIGHLAECYRYHYLR